MKKQMILGMASLMFAGMLSTGTVSAAGTPKATDVPVSYDNRNAVVDPDDPLAEWSVAIPTTVAFTKDVKTQKVDVELMALNGATTDKFTTTFAVKVEAKSTNGLEMLAEGDAAGAGLAYTVAYGTDNVTNDKQATTIATLNKTTLKKEGTATLDAAAKPTKLAVYSDTLTYTITKTAD